MDAKIYKSKKVNSLQNLFEFIESYSKDCKQKPLLIWFKSNLVLDKFKKVFLEKYFHEINVITEPVKEEVLSDSKIYLCHRYVDQMNEKMMEFCAWLSRERNLPVIYLVNEYSRIDSPEVIVGKYEQIELNVQNAIILNHMFTGDYLYDNIGHEVVNLFKDDAGDNYIYLCKNGNYNDTQPLPKYVIQVRRPHQTVHTLEIVNIATEVELYKGEQNLVKYGSIPVTKVFETNTEQQEKCITFKAGLVIKPQKPVYILYQGKDNIDDYENVVLKETYQKEDGETAFKFNVSQQLHEILIEGGRDFKTLDSFCEYAFMQFYAENGWAAVDEQVSLDGKTEQPFPVTPADIYGIGTWELAYSNAFKYFLENNRVFFKAFCELCSGGGLPSLMANEKPIIKREWKHIDLFIEYGKHLFIIENKIFSDLNGKDKNQLKDYEDVVNKIKDYNNKEKHFILLTPNHNKIEVEEPWKRIFYNSVLDICNGLEVSDEHFAMFIKMLEPHTEEDFNYAIMKKRFEKALLKYKK